MKGKITQKLFRIAIIISRLIPTSMAPKFSPIQPDQPTSQRISPRHRFNQRHPVPRRLQTCTFSLRAFLSFSPLSCTLINFYRIFHTFRSSIRRRSHAEKKLRKFSIFFLSREDFLIGCNFFYRARPKGSHFAFEMKV